MRAAKHLRHLRAAEGALKQSDGRLFGGAPLVLGRFEKMNRCPAKHNNAKLRGAQHTD
jgi:hypothetical protein